MSEITEIQLSIWRIDTMCTLIMNQIHRLLPVSVDDRSYISYSIGQGYVYILQADNLYNSITLLSNHKLLLHVRIAYFLFFILILK